MAAQTVNVGDVFTVDASALFSDPDADALSFGASSSDAGVVSVVASGSGVTVTAVSQGTATVTVTATDPGGLSAATAGDVTVENRAPEVVGSIPAQTLNVGDSVAVDASALFSDPDGDALSFRASSSDDGVVSVAASGSAVTVTAVSQGTATVTVTATDPGGLSAETTGEVTVGNRAPEVVGPMVARKVNVDDVFTVDASGLFTDPDGDALSFESFSSDDGVVAVAVSGSGVTVTAVSQGTATVTVTATDPGGLSAETTGEVSVENRAPEGVESIAIQTLNVGDSVTLDVSALFSDPDGDPLSFGASSSDAGVVSVTVSGSVVTVTAVSQGTATVTVTATDPGGLSADTTAEVSVENRAPEVVGSIVARTLNVGDSVTVEASVLFSDPDGDALSFRASSSDGGVVAVTVSGSVVTVTAVSQGTATVTVTATDPGGLSAETTGGVTVGNRVPEVVRSIPIQTLNVDDSVTVDASTLFSDPDGDALSFEAVSSDAGVVAVTVSGSVVTVTAASQGTATVTVTATDPGGLSAETEIVVTALTSVFRDDFDGSGGLAAGWSVRMADARIAGGVLNLVNTGATQGEAARVLEGAISSWRVVTSAGRGSEGEFTAGIILETGDDVYTHFRLLTGELTYGDEPVNYLLQVYDSSNSRYWHFRDDASGVRSFGRSEGIAQGAGEFTDLAIRLSGGRLHLVAGSELLLAGDMPDGFPMELTGVALVVNSPDGARRTALFDWVEVQMTGAAGSGVPTASLPDRARQWLSLARLPKLSR